MVCPHCLKAIHSNFSDVEIGRDKFRAWSVNRQVCPSCGEFIIRLFYEPLDGGRTDGFLAYPRGTSRSPVSADVPAEFAGDYREACLVLSDSPKASAALSRRCLQHILREKAGVKKQDLSKEIEEVIGSGKLPTHLSEGIDAVRNIGAFAAHPIKSTSTGEIVDVEPGEAEWLLDILEGLFDFYFVQPAVLKRKKEDLNKKLADSGKPPMKE